jgi:heat shock protein HslJ
MMNRFLRLPLLFAAAAALLATAACATPAAGPLSLETPDAAEPASVVGTWSQDAPGEPHLAFTESGGVEGSDGCNGLGGTYTVDGDQVSVELGLSTMMACVGVDTWLHNIASATFDGDTMTVFDSSGAEIGQLQRD